MRRSYQYPSHNKLKIIGPGSNSQTILLNHNGILARFANRVRIKRKLSALDRSPTAPDVPLMIDVQLSFASPRPGRSVDFVDVKKTFSSNSIRLRNNEKVKILPPTDQLAMYPGCRLHSSSYRGNKVEHLNMARFQRIQPCVFRAFATVVRRAFPKHVPRELCAEAATLRPKVLKPVPQRPIVVSNRRSIARLGLRSRSSYPPGICAVVPFILNTRSHPKGD